MKSQPSEEENTQYEFRCHQCGEVFMDDIFGYEYPLTPLMLAKPKKCPYCGSVRIMPVMYEFFESQAERYQRMWEQMEKKAKEIEERTAALKAKRANHEQEERE